MRIEATEFARAFCLCLCTFICPINCALDNVCCLMRDATSASETRDIIVRHNSRTQPEEKKIRLQRAERECMESAAAHFRVPTLRRYAATSLLLRAIANSSGDFPLREQKSWRVQYITKNANIFKRTCRGGRTSSCLLHARQLSSRREIGRSQGNLLVKSNGAETSYCENKRVNASEVKQNPRPNSSVHVGENTRSVSCSSIPVAQERDLQREKYRLSSQQALRYACQRL